MAGFALPWVLTRFNPHLTSAKDAHGTVVSLQRMTGFGGCDLEGLGLKGVASAAEANKRLAVLRGHRWSSYRLYAGSERAPA